MLNTKMIISTKNGKKFGISPKKLQSNDNCYILIHKLFKLDFSNIIFIFVSHYIKYNFNF